MGSVAGAAMLADGVYICRHRRLILGLMLVLCDDASLSLLLLRLLLLLLAMLATILAM